MSILSQDGEDALLLVKVVPGASRTRVLGRYGDRIRIAVSAAAERGKANAELARFLAEAVGIRSRDVIVESGETSALKRIRLVGAAVEKVRSALGL